MLLTDFLAAFRQGKELANAATWKNRTLAANALCAVLSAAVGLATFCGYRVDLDNDTLQALAGGIAALVCVVNSVMHTVTSERVGLPASLSDGNAGVYQPGRDPKPTESDFRFPGHSD